MSTHSLLHAGSNDREEELTSARAHELMSTHPSMSKRATGGPSSSAPSSPGSRKRPCLSPGQHPRQQPKLPLQFPQEGQVIQLDQPSQGLPRQPEQPNEATKGQQNQPEHQGPDVDQGSQ
eukprot:scaffold15704_cov17-Tisochrysis_lutea.AAC.2